MKGKKKLNAEDEAYETKNLSSLKFNFKHMADAGATNSDNHGMYINKTKPNRVCSAPITRSFSLVFFFLFYSHAFSCFSCVFSSSFSFSVLTQFSDCCKLESEKLDSKR